MGAEALAQLQLGELAGGGERDLLDEHHGIGHPPLGDLAFEAGQYLLLRQRGALTRLHDQHGPLGRHEAEQRLQKIFSELDPDMQAFLANPTNVTYMGTAKILSEMDVQRLRQVAESILDITF